MLLITFGGYMLYDDDGDDDDDDTSGIGFRDRVQGSGSGIGLSDRIRESDLGMGFRSRILGSVSCGNICGMPCCLLQSVGICCMSPR